MYSAAHAGHHVSRNHRGRERNRTRFHVGFLGPGAGFTGKKTTAQRKAKLIADRAGRPIQVFDREKQRFIEVRPAQHLCPNPHCAEPLSPAEFVAAWKVGTCSSCGAGPEHVDE